jgi:hypothetical protein
LAKSKVQEDQVFVHGIPLRGDAPIEVTVLDKDGAVMWSGLLDDVLGYEVDVYE